MSSASIHWLGWLARLRSAPIRASTSSMLKGSMTVARFAGGLRTALTGLIVSSPLRTAWAQIDCRTASDLRTVAGPSPSASSASRSVCTVGVVSWRSSRCPTRGSRLRCQTWE